MRLRSLSSRIARITLVASLVVAAMGSAPRLAAAAESGDLPTAVLGVEALEGTPETVASEITDALRQRIAATKGFQLIQGKDLVEVKLVFSCPDEAPACMSQAGKSMGAAKLIFGNVKRSGGDYLVTLKLLDVSRGTVESWVAETVPKKKAEPAAFRSLTPAWLAKLTGKGIGGSLAIRANVQGAVVSLDGTRIGMTGQQPVTIADVSPGHHEVAVEKSGYTNTKQDFTLASGQSLPLSLSLSPVSVEVGGAHQEPVLVHRPEDGDATPDGGSSRSLSRAGFWVAVVGTLTSAALALKFGNDVRQINRDLDPYRRFQCNTSNTGLCDARGDPKPPLTLQDKTVVSSKTDDGNRAQTLQWVFVGLAPPFAIAAGFLLYKGYLQSESREGHAVSSDRGLRIFPTATASARGIIAEFDF
jgi:hypothetical protein